MLNQRASGILLHPTSLPGAYGSGDFGSDAYRFVDWLSNAGQSYWQVLPLNGIGPGNSPYMSNSAFAGNILMIDLVELAQHGWLTDEDLNSGLELSADRVDFNLVQPFRINCLRAAATKFFSNRHDDQHSEYADFCETSQAWLDDYALFMTINEREHGRSWTDWPQALIKREPAALQQLRDTCADEINFWQFCQWCFVRQWSKLKQYANDHSVSIVGDVPIFVAYQSADVWAHQELFKLDEKGKPTVVAGVPPDYFSETGQLWGNPLYRWEQHEKSGFSWWVARLRHALQQADIVRIDHFRGFSASWEVPADAENAISGEWVTGPGDKLFEAFAKSFPHLPIIAEDLGVITQDVEELRDKFKLPGMRILQFAFGEGDDNYFLPHHHIANCIAYTGTHDNDTTLGWWDTAPEHVRDFARRYLACDGQEMHLHMMRALAGSVANTVIFPLQDVLGLGSDHRMNYPGIPEGNWEWRFTWHQVQHEKTDALAEITRTNGRIPSIKHS